MNAADAVRKPSVDADILDTRISPPTQVRPEQAKEPAPVPAPGTSYGIRRAAALLVLVLLLQLGFVAAYIGGLASPSAGSLPVAVVAGDAAVKRVQQVAGDEASAVEYADRRSALQAVHDRRAYAALVPDGTGGTELRIATTQSDPAAGALVDTYGSAGRAAGIPIVVFDDYSPRPNNSRSVATFFLVVGWVVGGFLAATALAIALGSVPATQRRTQARVLGLLAYAVVAGVASSIVVGGPGLDVWTGDGVALATFGAMITFGAAMTAAALQGWFGLAGAGAAIALFVLLGAPGFSGPVPADALPGFLRDLQAWALPGAGTHLVRNALYFGSGSVTGEMIAVWVYCLGGAIAFLVAGHVKPGRIRARLLHR
jgi:hypothetical protein